MPDEYIPKENQYKINNSFEKKHDRWNNYDLGRHHEIGLRYDKIAQYRRKKKQEMIDKKILEESKKNKEKKKKNNGKF